MCIQEYQIKKPRIQPNAETDRDMTRLTMVIQLKDFTLWNKVIEELSTALKELWLNVAEACNKAAFLYFFFISVLFILKCLKTCHL